MNSRAWYQRRIGVMVVALSLVVASAGVGWSQTASGLVNVNTATASELQGLPGIGPSKAGAIIAYRSAHGPFKRVDDLVEVKGIGPKTLAKLRPLVTCGSKKKGPTSPRRGK